VKKSLRNLDLCAAVQSRVSLRAWLQASTVLALLAGYALFVASSLLLDRIDRHQAHQELQSQLAAELLRRAPRPERFREVVDGLLLPGLQLDLVPPRPEQTPRVMHQGERTLLESSTVMHFADGRQQSLRLRQDVSAAIRRQNLSLNVLALAAAGAALVTALLLRPVLNRRLVHPLEALCSQLSSYQLPPAQPVPLDVAAQPAELQPIAACFNAMRDRLAASWERQRSFVDGVAHELRTPITLISGHAQSLQRSPAAAALGPSLVLISAEARRMGALVSDMLDLARKDAGRLELHRLPVDLEDVLLESYERLAPGSQGRLRIEPPPQDGLLPLAAGDQARLEQCLAALVDNALRYAPAGPITLSGELADGEVVLHVRDHGPGVAEAERDAIFERFVRGTAAVDTRGSGIGLSVAQLLMQAMGGRLTVGETEGGGADFRIHLPIWQPLASGQGPP
jgi:signal transduction histidine kinase